MPAKSAAQRRFIYATKGARWARAHHFDTPGPLPARKKRRRKAVKKKAKRKGKKKPAKRGGKSKSPKMPMRGRGMMGGY